MTEFVFALTSDAPDALGARIMTELSAIFPEHSFMFAKSGEFEEVDFANAIFPVNGKLEEDGTPIGSEPPDPKTVTEVKLVFQELLTEMKGWKPS